MDIFIILKYYSKTSTPSYYTLSDYITPPINVSKRLCQNLKGLPPLLMRFRETTLCILFDPTNVMYNFGSENSHILHVLHMLQILRVLHIS